MMSSTRIANQNWIDLPSADIRTQTVEICRILKDAIDEYIVQGSFLEVVIRAEEGQPISMREIEELS